MGIIVSLRNLLRHKTNDELTQEQKIKLDSVGFTWSGSWASGKELLTKESCLVKQQEKTDFSRADGSIGIATIKSNLFGMTLEQTVCANCANNRM